MRVATIVAVASASTAPGELRVAPEFGSLLWCASGGVQSGRDHGLASVRGPHPIRTRVKWPTLRARISSSARRASKMGSTRSCHVSSLAAA